LLEFIVSLEEVFKFSCVMLSISNIKM
jgi:hypothetical protein